MINRLPKEFAASTSTTTSPASRISDVSGESLQGLRSRMLDAAAECVGSRPILSLSFMFALGLVLGKLVKR
jgi:hypothetical protein